MPISLLGFPAMNTKRISWGSCRNLFPSWLSPSPPMGPLVLPTLVAMQTWPVWDCLLLSGSEQAVFLSHTSIVQTHVSSLGKTWCSTFSRSQQNERKKKTKKPNPHHVLQFCSVCKTCLYGSAEHQCPTFIPHIAQLKIHWDFKQGPCCEPSEQAGVAAAPTPAQCSLAVPALCRAPGAIYTSPWH